MFYVFKETVGDAEKRAQDQNLLNKGEDDDKKVKAAIIILYIAQFQKHTPSS
jgi:hypothetical protein